MALPPNLITIYGRKPVLEALQDSNIAFFRVHLANSNQDADILRNIKRLCQQRQIEICVHDRMALSRISKNRKQDQGVAADILHTKAQEFSEFLRQPIASNFSLVALNNITNPQNLGMIIRTVAASRMHGILLPRRGCARLDALVIKASAGCVFRCPLYFCDSLVESLQQARAANVHVYGLSLESNSRELSEVTVRRPNIVVLGNESEGLSKEIQAVCNEFLHILMHKGVESLNVSVAAGILAFSPRFISGID